MSAIGEAVRVFGPGNVYGVFVLGLEARHIFMEGVRAPTELDANDGNSLLHDALRLKGIA